MSAQVDNRVSVCDPQVLEGMTHGLTKPTATNPHITHSRAVRGLIVLLQSQDCSGSLIVDPGNPNSILCTSS